VKLVGIIIVVRGHNERELTVIKIRNIQEKNNDKPNESTS